MWWTALLQLLCLWTPKEEKTIEKIDLTLQKMEQKTLEKMEQRTLEGMKRTLERMEKMERTLERMEKTCEKTPEKS